MSSVKEETVSGFKWSAIERFSLQGVQFVLGLIMARILNPEDYGIVGMLGIFFAIAQSFIDSGFSNALIRKPDRKPIDFDTVFYFNIVLGAFCYGVMFLIAPYVADFFNTPILKDVLRVLAINLFISSLCAVQSTRLTINVDFKTQAKISLTSAVTSGVIGVVLAYNGFGVWALVYQSIISAVVRAILLWGFSKWRPRLQFSTTSFKAMYAYGSKLLLSGLLHTLYMNMTTLVIGKFYSAKDLAYYSRGEGWASLPSTNITGIIQRVTFPIFAKIQEDDARLIGGYRKMICITSLAIFFGMMLMAAIAKPLVLILLTDKWASSIIFVQIFCFALMFDHLCQLNLNLLQVKGRSDLFLKLEMIKKTISFAILLASIPLGVVAICLSKVLYTQIAVFINTYYTGKLFGLSYRQQFKDYMPYFVKAVISCLPAYLLSYVAISPYFQLPIGVIMSIVIYYSLLRRDMYMIELKEIVLAKIKRK
jgi:O-antigen/teichoic acid export membrane protein